MFLKLPLQYFSADGTGGGGPEVPTNPETPETPEALTMEQVQKLIQSETDKIRTQYSKKLKDLETEKTELERAKMSEEERKAAEVADFQKQLAEKEQALLQKEMEILSVDLLKENDLPLEFKAFVVDVSAESVESKIQTLKSVWDEAIKTAVSQKFQDSGRTITKPAGDNTITKEMFQKMSYTEKLKVFNEDIDLYNKLSK